MCDFLMTEYSNLKAHTDKYKWHKYPEEKPSVNTQYLVSIGDYPEDGLEWYLVAVWLNDEQGFFASEPVQNFRYSCIRAWKEIEPYEVSENA